MRFLRKHEDASRRYEGLRYPTDAVRIRLLLLEDQHGFCAYSEKHVRPTDAAEVEHFDSRKKATREDGYWNWYGVLRWLNVRKRRAVPEPLLEPWSEELAARIQFDGVEYRAVDPNDRHAVNLIEFPGMNREELVTERLRRIRLLTELRGEFGERTEFLKFLRRDREFLSFLTALEAVFSLSPEEVHFLLEA